MRWSMVAKTDGRNSGYYRATWHLSIVLLLLTIQTVSAQQQSNSDSLIITTKRAVIIVEELIAEEDSTLVLVKQLRVTNLADSLNLVEQIRIQNMQKARLIALSNELTLAMREHDQLITELNYVKPAASDLILPVSGGLIAYAFTNGETGQKAGVGVAVFAILMTLEHYGYGGKFLVDKVLPF